MGFFGVRSIFIIAACGIITSLAGQFGAKAEEIIQTQTLSSQKVPWSQGIDFTKFNLNSGTLNSVKLTIWSNLQLDGFATNSSSTSVSGSLLVDVITMVTDEHNYIKSGGDSGGWVFTIPEIRVTLGPYEIRELDTYTTTTGVTVLDTNAPEVLDEFSSLIGTDTTQIQYAEDLEVEQHVGSISMHFAQQVTKDATLVLEYHYTPIPEPSTLALAMAGGLAVAAFRLKRHSATGRD